MKALCPVGNNAHKNWNSLYEENFHKTIIKIIFVFILCLCILVIAVYGDVEKSCHKKIQIRSDISWTEQIYIYTKFVFQ